MFLNGDVRHAAGCRGSMPVLLTRWDPDNVTWPHFLDLTTPLLNPPVPAVTIKVWPRADAGAANPFRLPNWAAMSLAFRTFGVGAVILAQVHLAVARPEEDGWVHEACGLSGWALFAVGCR
jgi:hypothetical protein